MRDDSDDKNFVFSGLFRKHLQDHAKSVKPLNYNSKRESAQKFSSKNTKRNEHQRNYTNQKTVVIDKSLAIYRRNIKWRRFNNKKK